MLDNIQKNQIKKESIFGAKNYKPLPVVLERGQGEFLWDVSGNKYLDMMSAYSAVSHGHSHPELVKVVIDQVQKLSVVSRAFYSKSLGDFLEHLVNVAGLDVALPMNTGAEAVETAIKAARKWAYINKGVPQDKAEIIVVDGNFHGRTTTIVSFSSDESYKKDFGPLTPGFVQAKYCSSCACPVGDCVDSIKSIKNLINENTAAILIEPIQGEAGIIVPRQGWLKAVRELCDRTNILLLVDEIQSGLGRTGSMFAFEHEDIKPDGLIVGKALGGGILPVSAFIAKQEIMDNFIPGTHGSTFGGNPLAAAVGKRALELLVEEELIENSKNLGEQLKTGLKSIGSDVIKEVRGRGLWIGVELNHGTKSANNLCMILLNQGILTKETHDNVIRFAPPLMISQANLDWSLEKISQVIKKF